MKISEILTSLMDSRGVTAYKLWKETDIPQAMIGRWKSGKAEPSLEKIQVLADYFDVSADFLLGKTNDPTPADKKNTPLEEMESREVLRQALIKEGIIPADRPMTDEERNALFAMCEAFFNRQKQ